MKLRENKLKEKLDSHMIPETCTEIRATFKIKNYHSGGQRPHPYKHEQNRPFLGQTPHSAVSRGATAASGGKQNLGTREGKESSGEKNH